MIRNSFLSLYQGFFSFIYRLSIEIKTEYYKSRSNTYVCVCVVSVCTYWEGQCFICFVCVYLGDCTRFFIDNMYVPLDDR